MEATVGILSDLWRHRVLVRWFFVVALLVGLFLLFRPGWPPSSREYSVGAASAQILVDTPESQMVEVAPKGSETLGARASLLANLMAQGEVKAAIARRAGLRPDRLLTAGPGASAPSVGGAAAKPGPDSYILSTGVVTNADGQALPIISVATQAPDARRAAQLANAAVDGLGAYLDAKALAQEVDYRHRLRARGLGPALAHTVAHGPGRKVALLAVIFIFGALCASLLLLAALVRTWRSHVTAENSFGGPDEGASVFDFDFDADGASGEREAESGEVNDQLAAR
jgi:hypothetical protein